MLIVLSFWFQASAHIQVEVNHKLFFNYETPLLYKKIPMRVQGLANNDQKHVIILITIIIKIK